MTVTRYRFRITLQKGASKRELWLTNQILVAFPGTEESVICPFRVESRVVHLLRGNDHSLKMVSFLHARLAGAKRRAPVGLKRACRP
jgi:hypothetical protein